MPYKRSNINGTSPLDLKAVNDNFSALWMKVFGDISMSDIDDSIKSMLYSNWLQPQGEGNLDSSYPFIIRFYIPPNTHSIRKAELNLIASKYRMDSDIALNNTANVSITGLTVGQSTVTSSSANGGQTKTSTGGGGTTSTSTDSGGQTRTSGLPQITDQTADYVGQATNIWGRAIAADDHTHILGVKPHNHNVTIAAHNHNVSIPSHTHDITVDNHTHDITHTHNIETTATLPQHSHPLSKGIVVDTDTLPNIFAKVNGVDLGLTLNDSRVESNNVNVVDKLLIGQWNTIEVSCSNKTDGTKGIARITVYGIVELLQNYK